MIRDFRRFKILFQAVLVGLLSGFLVVVFKWTVESVFGYFQHAEIWNSAQKWWLVPLITTLGGLFSGLFIFKFAPEASGSGIPFIKMVLGRVGAVVRLRSIWVKFVSGVFALGSGMPLGREGPSVQLGAGAGMLVAKVFGVSGTHTHKLVAAGSGSALGAVFNAPIAGTIFVFEELLRKFSPALLFPVLVATVVAASAARFFFGDYPSFLMPALDAKLNAANLVSCLFIGVVAGVSGSAFSWLVIKFRSVFAHLSSLPNYSKPALAGLIVGILALCDPRVLGSGNQLIESLLFQQLNVSLILVLLAIRFILTPLCFGSGFAGGIFLPMLMIGAFLGYLCSALASFLGMDVNNVILALVGMAAFMAAVAQTPITAVVMVFEMSSEYNYILPIMLAAAVANLVSSRLGYLPIYTQLQLNAMLSSSEAKLLSQTSVSACSRSCSLFLPPQMPIVSALSWLKSKNLSLSPVVDGDKSLKGFISQEDIHDALIENNSSFVPVENVMNPSPVKVLDTSDLFSLYFRLHDEGESFAVVVDELHQVKGIVSNNDIYNFLQRKKNRAI